MGQDDPEVRHVTRTIGKWEVVRKKLIPLLKQRRDDQEVVTTLIKILYMLTKPMEPKTAKSLDLAVNPKASDVERKLQLQKQTAAREQV